MGIQNPIGQAREFLTTAALETDFKDTATTIAAANSFLMLGAPSVEVSEERVNRTDANSSRGYVERIRRRRTNSMEIPSYILPPGGATPPDVGPLLAAAMGSETVGASDVTYALSSDLQSIALHMVSQDVQGWHAYGCAVDTLDIELPEGDEPTFNFGLIPALVAYTGRTTASGAIDGSGSAVTSIPLGETGAHELFDVGSEIAVGTSTGHRVTAVDRSANTLTITPGVSDDQGTDPTILPSSAFDEAEIAAASPVGLTQGQIDWDPGVGSAVSDVCIRSASISLANNYSPIDCWGRETATDMTAGRREITGNLTLWARSPDILRAHLGRSRSVATRQAGLTFILGDNSTSGNPIVTISCPQAELEFPTYDISDDGPNSISVEFRAMESTVGANDEMTIVFGSSS